MSSRSDRVKRTSHRTSNRCGLGIYEQVVDPTEAVVIPPRIDPGAEPLRCWHNVKRKVKKSGGKAVSGWLVYDHGPYFRLLAHDVWEDPEGHRWDVTPGSQQGDLFVPDARAGAKVPIGHQLKGGATLAETQQNFRAMTAAMQRDWDLLESGHLTERTSCR